jgi:hypothetical protein
MMNSNSIPFFQYSIVANCPHYIHPLPSNCLHKSVCKLVKCQYCVWNNLKRERIPLLCQDVSAKAALTACHKRLLLNLPHGTALLFAGHRCSLLLQVKVSNVFLVISVLVWFVLGLMAVGEFFLQVPCFGPDTVIPPVLYNHLSVTSAV